MKKRIVIFGATGATGQKVVEQALAQDYQVSGFVRNPSKMQIKDKDLELMQGDVLNFEHVSSAVKGQDAVVCCLGMPASDKSTLRADGTANIIKAMKKHGVQRLICQTSLGFADSKKILPWHMKYLIVPFILKNAFRDHELQESKIEASNLDWTIVRPGNMTNGSITGNYKSGFSADAKIKLKISRADVAHYILEVLNKNKEIHSKVGISY